MAPRGGVAATEGDLTGQIPVEDNEAIDELAAGWKDPATAAGVFARLEDDCHGIERFRRELAALQQHVHNMRRQLALPEQELGHRR